MRSVTSSTCRFEGQASTQLQAFSPRQSSLSSVVSFPQPGKGATGSAPPRNIQLSRKTASVFPSRPESSASALSRQLISEDWKR